MNVTRRVAGLAVFAALCMSLGNAQSTNAQATGTTPAGGQDAGGSKQPYTMAEYNAYQAAAAEKNPSQQVKLLDDFVSKYPNSALLTFVYPLYYQAYGQLKNYQKVIEYADKTAALGDKIDASARFNAYYTHSAAYNALLADPKTGPVASKDVALAKSAQEAAQAGIKTLADVKKPDNLADDAWGTQKNQFTIFQYNIVAQTATTQKDYPTVIDAYKNILKLNPDDAIVSYNLGKAYLSMTPPQTLDGFWAIARAVTSKTATQQQVTQLKTYLRKLIANYQQAACENLTDAELNELLQLAGSSADRPDSYKLSSADELATARKDMTIASVIADLKAGGDKGKVTWLAACGLEFPGVPGKVIEVAPGTDAITFKVAFVTSEAEFDAATTPNMDVKVVGQPEAARVEKDSAVHITGTLVAFDPDPAFMLHWDKAKVSDEDIPKEKEGPKKPARRPAPKKPAAKN